MLSPRLKIIYYKNANRGTRRISFRRKIPPLTERNVVWFLACRSLTPTIHKTGQARVYSLHPSNHAIRCIVVHPLKTVRQFPVSFLRFVKERRQSQLMLGW
jgi:hypothetical protein